MAVHTINWNPSTCWLQYSPLLPFQVYSLILKRKISDNMGAFFILLAPLFLPLPILASSDVAFPLKVSLPKYNCMLPPSVALILFRNVYFLLQGRSSWTKDGDCGFFRRKSQTCLCQLVSPLSILYLLPVSNGVVLSLLPLSFFLGQLVSLLFLFV